MSFTNPAKYALPFVASPWTDTHTQVNNLTWEDWNLSSVIGARACVIFVRGGTNNGNHGIRTNGAITAPVFNHYYETCVGITDGAGIIETYAATNEIFALMGYIPIL